MNFVQWFNNFTGITKYRYKTLQIKCLESRGLYMKHHGDEYDSLEAMADKLDKVLPFPQAPT